jgi:hypothetical protein
LLPYCNRRGSIAKPSQARQAPASKRDYGELIHLTAG